MYLWIYKQHRVVSKKPKGNKNNKKLKPNIMTTLITFSIVLFVVALTLILVNIVNELLKAIPAQKLVGGLFAIFAGSFLVMGFVGVITNLF